MKYVPLDRILSKLYRDMGFTEIPEVDVIEWCGEALDHIGMVTMYEKIVSIANVKNHSCELPIGLQYIEYVAYNTGNKLDTEELRNAIEADEVRSNNVPLSNADLSGYSPTTEEDSQYQYVRANRVVEEEGTDIVGDSVSYRNIFYPFINIGLNYYSYIRQQFIPLRLANHSLFGSLVLYEDTNMMFGLDQYSVVNNMLRFSFKDGQILISYYRQPLDNKTGYPMIPDHVSVIQAVTSYVVYKYMQRAWYLGRQGYDAKMQKAEQDWHWYCKQAKAVLIMPKGVAGHQALLEQENLKLPRMNRFYGFFGNLSNRK